MVSFRGNSIHAPSRDPSVLPSEARVICGAVERRYHGAALPRFVQLTAQLSQRGSHTVTPAIYVPIPSDSRSALIGPGNLREKEREREVKKERESSRATPSPLSSSY